MNPLTCEVVFLILCFVIPITLALQTRRKLLGLIGGDDANALSVLGANFLAALERSNSSHPSSNKQLCIRVRDLRLA